MVLLWKGYKVRKEKEKALQEEKTKEKKGEKWKKEKNGKRYGGR